jgi:hypothetical protein
MPETTPAPADARARERDRVRERYAQALARRASAHVGAARRVLDAKLAALLDHPVRSPDDEASDAGARAPRGPLADLVAHAARQKPSSVLGAQAKANSTSTDKPAAAPAPEAKTLQFFKRTWSRLSADQRLAQSRATLPDNAGPLNSHHLVHRSLTLMRELSPEYLEHFVAYVDALQWLEQSNEAEAAELAPGARTATPRRSAALRRG